MCYGCIRLGFETPSSTSEVEEDVDEPAEIKQPRQLPLRKKLEPGRKTVVRPGRSHDGAPAFVAFSVLEDVPEDTDLSSQKPGYAFVVYDTTPGAIKPERAADLARSIFEETFKERCATHLFPDRVEVFSMPVVETRSSFNPSATSDDGKLLESILPAANPWYSRLAQFASDPRQADHLRRTITCMKHYELELQSRLTIQDRAEAASWYLPERLGDPRYARSIIVIDRLEDDSEDPDVYGDGKPVSWCESLGWTEKFPDVEWNPMTEEQAERSPYGSVLDVRWQLRPKASFHEDDEEEAPLSWSRKAFELVGRLLFGPEHGVEDFHQHFVPDGVMDFELSKARAS